MTDFTSIWMSHLEKVMREGSLISPRGQVTREILQSTIRADMRHPVLMLPSRKLSYKFLAAEAYWILSGDNRVETISPYNKNISQFSDDGITFFGAYGPEIVDQLPYVITKLCEDNSSRQAGLTIWRKCPPKTKDVPCTVAIFFSIRGGKLNVHVFMRSSDVWLGVPYDVFNFSMLGHKLCGHLREHGGPIVSPGTLFLTAASSHVYERNFEGARSCLLGGRYIVQRETPENLYSSTMDLMDTLKMVRESSPGDSCRWWEQ